MTREEAIEVLQRGLDILGEYADSDLGEAHRVAISALSENKGDLISRQAVLDELEKWDWQDLYLPIHFKQILDDVPSVENKGEWIPVIERLPEEHEEVLTCSLGGFIAIQSIELNYWENQHGEWSDMDEVIAWQPLPEPYKAEKHETCKGCLEPCIMYEPDMRACKHKVTEKGGE